MPTHTDTRQVVFVVEPDAEVRNTLEALLSRLGWTPRGFKNGREALAGLGRERPQLLVVELLLPGVDGFELCQTVRTRGETELPILCISGLTWGTLNLGEVVKRRFAAHFLRKPFTSKDFLSTVGTLLRPTTDEPAGESAAAWSNADASTIDNPVGLEGAARAADLTRRFESQVANVPTEQTRRSVRVEQEYCVEFETLGAFVREYTHNISAGGMFIKSSLLPSSDEVLNLSFTIPHLNRTINVRGRVVYHVSPEEAEARGGEVGFGVAFVDISPEDEQFLEELVRDLKGLRATPVPKSPPAPATEELPRNVSLVLLGVEPGLLLRTPGFLHRSDVELTAFSSIDEAEDYLAVNAPTVCVIHEEVAGHDPTGAGLSRLAALLGRGTQRLVLSNRPAAAAWLRAGLCEAVIDSRVTGEQILDELRLRLGVTPRGSPRIYHRTSVLLSIAQAEHPGTMINISAGGMLLRVSCDCVPGQRLRFDFDLPAIGRLACHGNVLRVRRDPGAREALVAVAFTDIDDATATALRRFIQAQVNFREYFGWMKKNFFSVQPATAGSATEDAPRGPKKRDIFGLGS